MLASRGAPTHQGCPLAAGTPADAAETRLKSTGKEGDRAVRAPPLGSVAHQHIGHGTRLEKGSRGQLQAVMEVDGHDASLLIAEQATA